MNKRKWDIPTSHKHYNTETIKNKMNFSNFLGLLTQEYHKLNLKV